MNECYRQLREDFIREFSSQREYISKDELDELYIKYEKSRMAGRATPLDGFFESILGRRTV